MRMDLNLEAESFESYGPFQNEEAEKGPHGGGHGPRVHHGPHHHGGWHGRHRSRFRHRFGRWPWLQGGFGGGDDDSDAGQDPQTVAWAQGCLSQLTGNMLPRSGQIDSATRRAIGMFQSQQQLSATGTLDDDTLSALQAACGDQGSQEIANEFPPGFGKPDGINIWFELNSTRLRQDSDKDSVIHLAVVVGACRRHLKAKGRAARIIIHGFASREGSEARNRELAGQRAQRVKELLADADLPEDRMQVVNDGISTSWPTLRDNRRVVVELQPQP